MSWLQNGVVVKIKQFWMVIFLLADKLFQTQLSWLENKLVVKIKQFGMVIFLLADKLFQTVQWLDCKIKLWLK